MMACDAVGFVASGFVLAAFAARGMVRLRLLALCSNVAFLAYGAALTLWPIVVLHALLLPINAWRLRDAIRPVDGPSSPAPGGIAGSFLPGRR